MHRPRPENLPIPDDTYTVWSRLDLLTGEWTEEITVSSQGQLTTWTDPDTAAIRKFYRVALSSLPDTTPPVITLLGDNPMTLELGTPYAEPGVSTSPTIHGFSGSLKS